jgi:tRNA-dihydrouridine synthase B
LSEKILLAPFQGITGKNYRNAIALHIGGYDAFYAPFISGPGRERINPSKLKDLLPREESQICTIPQIISTDATEIILFAKTLSEYGYSHINWNLGCPFSRIANKKKGCGIMPYPAELDRLLEQIFTHISTALSIKVRLGYFSPEEIYPVLNVLNRFPLHLLIVHPRTGIQRYQGEVNLAGFRDCLRQSKNKVIYNGDIFNQNRYQFLKSMFPQADTWMLGRGALLDPFLALQIKGIKPGEQRKRMRLSAFHQDLLERTRQTSNRPAVILGVMKAIWYYMAGSFQHDNKLLGDIQKAPDIKSYQQAADIMLQQAFAGNKAKEMYFRHGLKHV